MLLTPIYWVETGNATAHRLVNLRLEKQQRIPMNANCDARARGLGRCRIWLLPVSFSTLRDGACRRRLVSTNIGSSSVRNRLQSTTSRPSTTNPMDGSWLFVWCWFEVNLDAASFPLSWWSPRPWDFKAQLQGPRMCRRCGDGGEGLLLCGALQRCSPRCFLSVIVNLRAIVGLLQSTFVGQFHAETENRAGGTPIVTSVGLTAEPHSSHLWRLHLAQP